jgi:hypothetical protein
MDHQWYAPPEGRNRTAYIGVENQPWPFGCPNRVTERSAKSCQQWDQGEEKEQWSQPIKLSRIENVHRTRPNQPDRQGEQQSDSHQAKRVEFPERQKTLEVPGSISPG